MNVEMQSMKDNEVWELVDLPPYGKTVGHKWLFKKKTDMDGAVHTYKAHLEMNVKIVFLNGYLNEEVYMEQPEGFVSQKYPNRVCKLKRSIYGLKQASRQWNKRFDDEIKKFRFSQNHDEPCVYVKASRSYVTFLILYVDDILIMGNNIPMLKDVKSYLGRCFAMKDLGEVAYILGIKIYRDRSKVSCYTDAGYLTHADGMKSQTGYVFILNGSAVDWKSTKQSIFATSSTDVEYITAFDTSKEVVWIRKFIFGLGVVPIIEEPINMYYDNTRAIAITKYHGVTKDDNLADPFTKALAFPKHSKLTEKIGMIPASSLINVVNIVDGFGSGTHMAKNAVDVVSLVVVAVQN
ncbi:retrovirus-related pol polyprotein from transposon TNT 1-94 [Tanacetum coccineum]